MQNCNMRVITGSKANKKIAKELTKTENELDLARNQLRQMVCEKGSFI